MSVGNTNSYIDHAGDGSLAQFDFGFPAISEDDIKCRITHTDGSTRNLESTEYSVVLSCTGGRVTVAVPPASGETLRIYRTTPITQDTGFDTGYINNADISNAMDKFTLIAQELKRAADGTMFSVGTVAQGSPASADIEDGKLNLVLPKGDKGDTGATGPSNTLSIGTVEGGATASATITGTSPNQTLNLVLPKGDKGNKGDMGEGLQTLKAGTYPTYDSSFAPYPLGALLWYPSGGYFVRSLIANNTNSNLNDTSAWAQVGVASKNIGEVFFSESNLAADNPGALPLFTGETINNFDEVYPGFWAWLNDHSGLQISAADYATAITTYGECAKYVVDTVKKTVTLPLLKNFVKMANTTDGITEGEAGLPNIEGSFAGGRSSVSPTGAFTEKAAMAGGFANIETQSVEYEFDASLSNSIYGNSNTVTPPHTTLYPWVFAFNVAVSASVAQAAEFQAALSGKVDLATGVAQADVDYVVDSYINGASWYRVYKSGWCEQGGLGVENTNIDLLKPYANLYYSVLLTGTTDWSSYTRVENISDTSSFIFRCGGDATGTSHAYWVARGYIAQGE